MIQPFIINTELESLNNHKLTKVNKPVASFFAKHKSSTIRHETYTSEISTLLNSINKRRCYAYLHLQGLTDTILYLSQMIPYSDKLKYWYDQLYPAVKIIVNLNILNTTLFNLEKRYIQLAFGRNKRPNWKAIVFVTSEYERKAIFDLKQQINSLINQHISPQSATQLISNVEKLSYMGKNVVKHLPILANITDDTLLNEIITKQVSTIIEKFVRDEPRVLANNIQYMKSLRITDDR
jgi:hypothetical protein